MRPLSIALLLTSLSTSVAHAGFVVKAVIQGTLALPRYGLSVEGTLRGAEMDGDPSSGEAIYAWATGFSEFHLGVMHLASQEVEEVGGLSSWPFSEPSNWLPGSQYAPIYADLDGDGKTEALLYTGGQVPSTYVIGWDAAGATPGTTSTVSSPTGAFPNPTPSSAAIRFANPAPGRVDLFVFDVTGRLVRKITTESREIGDQVLRWDGSDDGGREVPSGVYVYRIETAGTPVTGRLVLTR